MQRTHQHSSQLHQNNSSHTVNAKKPPAAIRYTYANQDDSAQAQSAKALYNNNNPVSMAKSNSMQK